MEPYERISSRYNCFHISTGSEFSEPTLRLLLTWELTFNTSLEWRATEKLPREGIVILLENPPDHFI